MAKKARRQRRPNLPPEAYNTPQAAVAARPAADKAATTAAPAQAPAQRRAAIDWKEEYGEVMGDLKRTAVLAAMLMAAMGVLAFIIR